jgi:DNA-binding MarR family transcriptional regulator
MDYTEFKAEVWENMYLIKTFVPKIFLSDLHKEGLNMIQLYILFKIDEYKSINITSLCKEFGFNQGNISTVCKNMEKLGLIKRTRSIEDERVVTLSLSEDGKKTIERIKSNKSDDYDEVLKKVPPEMLENIIRGMRSLNELLKILHINSNH